LISDRNAQRAVLQAKLAQRKSERDQAAAHIATLREEVATINAEAAAAAAVHGSGSGEPATPSSPAQVQAELEREVKMDRISRQCAATAESMQVASAEIARTQASLAQIAAVAAADDAATAAAADGTAEADTQAFLEAELSVATSALVDERASHNAVAAELAALVRAVELAGRGAAEAAVLRSARATGMDAAAVLIKHREAEQAVAVARARTRHEQQIKMKVRLEQRRLAREEARQAFDDIGAKLSASAPDDAADGASAASPEEAAAKREVALAAWSAAVQKRRTALAVELEQTEAEAATLWDTSNTSGSDGGGSGGGGESTAEELAALRAGLDDERANQAMLAAELTMLTHKLAAATAAASVAKSKRVARSLYDVDDKQATARDVSAVLIKHEEATDALASEATKVGLGYRCALSLGYFCT
jgi:hypothetical protein